MPKIGKRVSGMFQQTGSLAGFTRRHRRRQVYKPLGIRCKPAHDFQSSGGVFLANSHIAVQTRGDNALADHFVEIQQIIMLLLRG